MSYSYTEGGGFRNGNRKKVSDGENNDVLWNSWGTVFRNKMFVRIDREHTVYGCLNDWEIKSGPSPGWRIDYIADFQKRRYLIEAKLGEFDNLYSGFKIFAYRGAYCIDRIKHTSEVGVMIFFNSKTFERKMRGICGMANVEFAVITVKESDGLKAYELKECSLW